MMSASRLAARASLRISVCLALLPVAAGAQTIPSPPPRPFDLGGRISAGPALVTPPRSQAAGPDTAAAGKLVNAPTPPVRPVFSAAIAAARAASPAPSASVTTPAAEPEPVTVPPVPAAAPLVGSAVARAAATAAANAATTDVAAVPPPENFVSKLRNWFTPKDDVGDDEEDEWPRRTRGQRAALTAEPLFDPNEKPEKPGLSTDPGVSTRCLPETLQAVLTKVIERYGAVKVTSTYRPSWRARRGSYHRRCEAVDFRVPGVRPGEVLTVVKDYEETGGHKVYWNGLIHVDTGPYRTWRGARR